MNYVQAQAFTVNTQYVYVKLKAE